MALALLKSQKGVFWLLLLCENGHFPGEHALTLYPRPERWLRVHLSSSPRLQEFYFGKIKFLVVLEPLWFEITPLGPRAQLWIFADPSEQLRQVVLSIVPDGPSPRFLSTCSEPGTWTGAEHSRQGLEKRACRHRLSSAEGSTDPAAQMVGAPTREIHPQHPLSPFRNMLCRLSAQTL